MAPKNVVVVVLSSFFLLFRFAFYGAFQLIRMALSHATKCQRKRNTCVIVISLCYFQFAMIFECQKPSNEQRRKNTRKKVTLFGWARERTFKIPFYNLLSFYSLHFSLLFPSTFFPSLDLPSVEVVAFALEQVFFFTNNKTTNSHTQTKLYGVAY